MTVAQLIAILKTLPQDMPVRMSMNSEYECVVNPDMVYEFDGHVRIDSEGQDSQLADSYEVNPDQKRADERYGIPDR